MSHVQPIETIIVNNSATDTTLNNLFRSKAGINIVPNPENPGYGGGMNAGFNALSSTPDWIVIANPDVRWTPEAMSHLLDYGTQHPELAILGPQILDDDGSRYPSARSFPSLRNGIGHALFANIWKNNPWSHSYKQDRIETNEPRTVGWVSGAFMCIRTSAYTDLGGFDERYFMYFEDVDLCLRAHNKNMSIAYVPSAVIEHSGAHSTQSNKPQMLKAHHNSAYIFLASKYHAWYLWPLRVILRLGLTLRSWWGQVRG
jgi:N-acetylglucosaminyl-diphospho-decaprenol L-rhamnosyltransferase